MIGRIAGLLAIPVLALAINVIHVRVPPRSYVEGGDEFVPRPEFARLFALGFDAVVADYYWLRAIQIVGARDVALAGHAGTVARLIDVVTTLDPWVDHPYRFAAIWLTDTPERVRKANELLRRGIAHHPDEWRNPFYLGFNLYFYLGENREAADALEQASRHPGAPAYLPRLVARLRSQSEDLEAAAVFLAQMVRDAPDDVARASYQGALDEIEVEYKARALERARAAYVQLNGRDIERVEDLVDGPHAVLDRLPDPEPSSVPDGLSRGARWELDGDKRIVSTYYGRRYELSFHAQDAARREVWSAERSAMTEGE